jgi:hypothetical protein
MIRSLKTNKKATPALKRRSRLNLVPLLATPSTMRVSEARLPFSACQVGRGIKPSTRIGTIMAKKGESTSTRVASVAAKVLQAGKATPSQAKTLAGSALTQAPNHKRR